MAERDRRYRRPSQRVAHLGVPHRLAPHGRRIDEPKHVAHVPPGPLHGIAGHGARHLPQRGGGVQPFGPRLHGVHEAVDSPRRLADERLLKDSLHLPEGHTLQQLDQLRPRGCHVLQEAAGLGLVLGELAARHSPHSAERWQKLAALPAAVAEEGSEFALLEPPVEDGVHVRPEELDNGLVSLVQRAEECIHDVVESGAGGLCRCGCEHPRHPLAEGLLPRGEVLHRTGEVAGRRFAKRLRAAGRCLLACLPCGGHNRTHNAVQLSQRGLTHAGPVLGGCAPRGVQPRQGLVQDPVPAQLAHELGQLLGLAAVDAVPAPEAQAPAQPLVCVAKCGRLDSVGAEGGLGVQRRVLEHGTPLGPLGLAVAAKVPGAAPVSRVQA
mmetsp:Transcript_7288/g.29231  ORF Transcript_7288/g.29231 Transcript_7288/m.29231 type:complete len:381 (+) Transcript_7288:450-1592(+)